MPRKPTRRIARLLAAAITITLSPVAPAATPATDVEQFSLELINLARRDPETEVWRLRTSTWGDDPTRVPATNYPQPQRPDLNEGLAPNTISPAAKQPLAFNTSLIQSARDYSDTLLANNAFTHTFGGTSPSSRMTAAGYTFTAPSGAGENIAVTASSGALPISQAEAGRHHASLFIDSNTTGRGHRTGMLTAPFKEVGIGFGQKSGYTLFGGSLNAVLSTYDFAYSAAPASSKPFLTGVVFTDAVADNNFYDVGEGFGGVDVAADPSIGAGPSYFTTTSASGGYSLPLAGTYNITFSGGGLTAPITYWNVTVSNANVKIDASNDQGVWAADADGTWDNPANWSGQVPNGVGRVATLASKITAPRTVTLTADATVGKLALDSAVRYTIASSGTPKLIFDTGAPLASARLDAGAGSHVISAPIHVIDTLEIVNDNPLTLSGPLTSTATDVPRGIVKLGRGALRLAGNSPNFAGGITIANGTVTVAHSNALGVAPTTLGFEGNDVALILEPGMNVPTPITVAPGTGARRIATPDVSVINGPRTLSGPIKLGKDVVFSSTFGLDPINVTGVISDAGAASPGGVIVNSGKGPIVLAAANTYRGATTVQAGFLTLSGSIASSAALVLTGSLANVRLDADQDLKGLDVQNAAAGTQSLDLHGHRIRLFASDPAAAELTLRTRIAPTGSDGIYDSTAATSIASAVGYALSGGDHVLITRAIPGDANLDDAVDFNDLAALAQNYNAVGGNVWRTGDFDYDGDVDFNDLAKLAQNYNTALPTGPIPGAPAGFANDLATALGAVPEPGSASLLLFVACGMVARRRGKRRAPGAVSPA